MSRIRHKDAQLAIMERRAKLLSLDAEQQIGVTGEDSGPVNVTVVHHYEP